MYVSKILVFLAILTEIANADYKSACGNKVEGNACQYQSNKSTCCSMIMAQNGLRERFCRTCTVVGAMTYSFCGIHSRQGYLGCFSRKEDAAVFQVCVGQSKGSQCMYEVAAGRGSPASNTTGHCISHYNHGQIMCLEAIGQPDDQECAGKAVGMPCNHSTSANALCAHHSRRGNWMCLAPKEENRVFVVCQGAGAGTACSYTGSGSHGQAAGLVQGECQPHGSHGGMMCMNPSQLAIYLASLSDATVEDKSPFDKPWVIGLLVAGGVPIAGLLAFVSWIIIRRRPVAKSQSAVPVGPEVVVGQPAFDPSSKV